MSHDIREKLAHLKEKFQNTIDLTHSTNEWYDFADNADPDYVAGYQQAYEDFQRKYLKPGQKAPKGRKTGVAKDGRAYYETLPRTKKAEGSSTLKTMMKITHPENDGSSNGNSGGSPKLVHTIKSLKHHFRGEGEYRIHDQGNGSHSLEFYPKGSNSSSAGWSAPFKKEKAIQAAYEDALYGDTDNDPNGLNKSPQKDDAPKAPKKSTPKEKTIKKSDGKKYEHMGFYSSDGELMKYPPKAISEYGGHAVSGDSGNRTIWRKKKHTGGHHYEYVTGSASHYPGDTLDQLFSKARNYDNHSHDEGSEDYPDSQFEGVKSTFYDKNGGELNIPHVIGDKEYHEGEDEENPEEGAWKENPIHVMHKDDKGNFHLFFNDDENYHHNGMFSRDDIDDINNAIQNNRGGHTIDPKAVAKEAGRAKAKKEMAKALKNKPEGLSKRAYVIGGKWEDPDQEHDKRRDRDSFSLDVLDAITKKVEALKDEDNKDNDYIYDRAIEWINDTNKHTGHRTDLYTSFEEDAQNSEDEGDLEERNAYRKIAKLIKSTKPTPKKSNSKGDSTLGAMMKITHPDG